MHVTPSPTPAAARFQVFPQFNDPAMSAILGSRRRLNPLNTVYFPSGTLADRLARSLAEHRAMPFKEVLESFEFFWRVRRRLHATQVADLMCGHGLTGILFAVYDERVEEVILLDRKRPPSFDAIMDAVAEVAPWAPPKVRFVQDTLKHGGAHVPRGALVVGVHACGGCTDGCLDAAVAGGGPVAVMPCCYRDTPPAPPAVTRALGAELAWDVHRTYRLEAAGYRVRWTVIPPGVTVMNRVLLAEPPAALLAAPPGPAGDAGPQ